MERLRSTCFTWDDLSPHLFSATHGLCLRSYGTIVDDTHFTGSTKYTCVSLV